MSRYIDVDAFIKSFRKALPGLRAQTDPDLTPEACAFLRGGEAIIEDLAKFPSADVAPVVRGQWETDDYDSGEAGSYSAYIEVHCTKCGLSVGVESGQYDWTYGDPFPWHYCPDCGARMDGTKEKA